MELRDYLRRIQSGPRGAALAIADGLQWLQPVPLPFEPVAIRGQGVAALQAGNQEAVHRHVRGLVAANETNRSNLRGLLWAHRALMKLWDEDPSDTEVEDAAARVWGFLAQEWQCQEPPADEHVEAYLQRRFALRSPAVCALARGPEQPKGPERGGEPTRFRS